MWRWGWRVAAEREGRLSASLSRRLADHDTHMDHRVRVRGRGDPALGPALGLVW